MKRLVFAFVLFLVACDVQVGDRMVDPMPFNLRQDRKIKMAPPPKQLDPPLKSSCVERWSNTD